MNRKLLVAIVSGVLAAPMAAQVQADESELHGHSATVYGSLRYGLQGVDDGAAGSSTTWDIGTNFGSRFGIEGTVAAGHGLTAGFQLERALDTDLGQRFHNVSLSGPFGAITLGRQSSGYWGATSWDGSNHLGGSTNVPDKVDGASFGSGLGGPFEFKLFAGGGDGGDGADHIEASGSLVAGPVSFGIGFMEQADDGNRYGGTVTGTAANITLEIGYEAAEDITCVAATTASTAHTAGTGTHVVTAEMPPQDCDEDRYGFNLSYLIGAGPGGGNAFVQYGQRDSDDATAMKRDLNHWVVGYSYYVSESVTVNLEHSMVDAYNTEKMARLKANTSALVLKVDF